MNKQMICATIRRRKRNKPKAYIFDTQIQSFVENAMEELGYDNTQYWLSFVVVAPMPMGD